MDRHRITPPLLSIIGCLALALAVLFLCLMPFFMVELMQTALEKLHLSPQMAAFVVIGIFVGGLLFNFPVYRIVREEEQPVEIMAIFGFWGWMPQLQRVRRETIIAVNFGGCIIPLALAIWEAWHVIPLGGRPLGSLLLVTAANIIVCYLIARPINGVGIVMPALVSPLTAVGLTWILLPGPDFDPVRAPVAFVGGVVGPLVGADLLHLKDISKISVGILSIGGAGTFDGIVLSGILAAFLA